MARVLFVKPFTGLYLAVAQLSAELLRAGHETRIVHFKKFVAVPVTREHEFVTPPYAVRGSLTRGQRWIGNVYTPMSDREYALLLEEIRSFDANLIGMSLVSCMMPLAAELTTRLRQDVAIPIAWGGAGPTLEPEKAIEHADLVCVGEGEEAIVEMASRIDAGRPLHDMPGVWARDKTGKVFRNGHTEPPDFEKIAIPYLDVSRHVYIDEEVGRQPDFHHDRALNQYTIMTQRGCPFSCSFCVESRYQDEFGKSGSVRRRSVDLVIEELVEARKRFPFRQVLFYDDVFVTHRRWLVEFAEKYKRDVGLPFWCYTYPTTTRRDDIRMLRDVGLTSMTMGLQSGSQRILNEVFNRPTPLGRAIEAAEIILSEGVTLFFDLISRVPWETEDDLRATFELLLRFPKGIKLVGMPDMIAFPTYAYTERLQAEKPVSEISDEIYEYYHRLYILAISNLPSAATRALAKDPIYRKEPQLLHPFMPIQIDFPLPSEDWRKARRAAQRMIDTGFMQSVLDDEAAMPVAIRNSDGTRRLPLLDLQHAAGTH